MTSVGSAAAPAVRRMRAVRPVALAVRFAVVPFVALAIALLPTAGAPVAVFAGLGTALAVLAPTSAGALAVLAAEIVGWSTSFATGDEPSVPRTAAFAIAVYLTHTATALAAGVPLRADVDMAVLRAWSLRCLPGMAIAAAAAVLVGLLGRPAGSLVLDVVGFAAVAAAALVVAALARRR